MDAQLYVGDVAVGSDVALGSVGPLRIDQLVRFMFAAGVPEPGEDPAATHYDPWAAARAGMPDVFDMGYWRVAKFIQFAEAWGGPATRVCKIRTRFVEFAVRGEVIRFCGRVVGKRAADGGGEVDLEIWNEKGDGIRLTTGTMTLALPRRAGP